MTSVAPVRRLARIVNGGTPTPDEANWNGDVDWATPVDVGRNHGGVIESTERTITEDGLRSGSAQVPAGSLVLSTRAPVWYVARAGVDLAFNQGCKGLVPLPGVDPRYLLLALIHSIPEMEARATGTTFLELSTSGLAALPVPLPQEPDQVAISDFLDRETTQIDALVTEQQELVSLLDERKRGLLEHSLNEVWDSPRRRLKWLYRVSSESNQPDREVLSVYREFGVIPKSSRDDNFNKTPENLERYLVVRPDDLVVNRMKAWQGSLGVSRYEGIVSGDYEVVRPSSPELIPAFAHFMLRSPRLVGEYRARSTGIRPSQWRLYWEAMGTIEVPVPPLPVQEAQLARVQEDVTQMDSMIEAANESITLMLERRSALISAAVTGRIDPRTGQETKEAS